MIQNTQDVSLIFISDYMTLTFLKGLEERRERKRAKKNIMNPKSHSDSDEHDTEPQVKQKKGKALSKAKIPASLALIHGFLATNVGKNRITVCFWSRFCNPTY